ncbi:MAG: hypothetical protein L0Z53_23390 [Acidobacteriales bacterium]|nr:hypothetical protein [Terriglobales bacterium]
MTGISMAYFLELDKKTVSPFLLNVNLSREGRIKLFAGLFQLRDHADFYINEPSRRLQPNSPYFLYDYVFRDDDGDNRIHRFRFVVSDAAAKYGVLRIVYVDENGNSP